MMIPCQCLGHLRSLAICLVIDLVAGTAWSGPQLGSPNIARGFVGIGSTSGDEHWSRAFHLTGVRGDVGTFAIYEGDLIVGGCVQSAGEVMTPGVARWNGRTWAPLGTELGPCIDRLAVFKDSLYAFGYFPAANQTIDVVARWDGSSWTRVAGLKGIPRLPELYGFVSYGDWLIAAGYFSQVGDTPWHNGLVRYDGVSWIPMSMETIPGNPSVTVVAADDAGLYVGVETSQVPDELFRNKAFRWTEVGWEQVGGTMDGEITALRTYNGDLIAGGDFTHVDEVATSHIARWDGSAWHPLGEGLDGRVLAVTVFASRLIVIGFFHSVGGRAANQIAAWDGSSWTPLDVGVDGVPMALIGYGDSLVVGGAPLRGTDGEQTGNLAIWNGTAWGNPDPGMGIDGAVSCLARFGGRTIAGGRFTTAGKTEVHKIAAWDGVTWDSLGAGFSGGWSPVVSALAVYGQDLIAAGRFEASGAIPLSSIAAWDGTAWQPLQSGIQGFVLALQIYDGDLIAGGVFNRAGDVAVNNIARWDGSTWHEIGSGMDGRVEALTVLGGELFAGGAFTQAGGTEVRNPIARWDGLAWRALDSMSDTGICCEIHALTTYRGGVVAGGWLSLARWDGEKWSRLGLLSGWNTGYVGSEPHVYALSPYGSDLIVGGFFSSVSGAGKYVACLSDSGWTSLGSGVRGTVTALTASDSLLFLGGDFMSAGGGASAHVALWIEDRGRSPDWNGGGEHLVRLDSYPNPFQDNVTIRYFLPSREAVRIRVFDTQSRGLITLLDKEKGPGNHVLTWDGTLESGRKVPSGVYFLRIDAPSSGRTTKVLRVR